MVDDLEGQELVVVLVDAEDEVEAGVATEDELQVVGPLDEVAEARRARRDGVRDVAQHACALLRREDVVVLGKAHLALPVAQNHGLDLLSHRHRERTVRGHTKREKQSQGNRAIIRFFLSFFPFSPHLLHMRKRKKGEEGKEKREWKQVKKGERGHSLTISVFRATHHTNPLQTSQVLSLCAVMICVEHGDVSVRRRYFNPTFCFLVRRACRSTADSEHTRLALTDGLHLLRTAMSFASKFFNKTVCTPTPFLHANTHAHPHHRLQLGGVRDAFSTPHTVYHDKVRFSHASQTPRRSTHDTLFRDTARARVPCQEAAL